MFFNCENPINLKFKLKNDRLYVSAIFKHFRNSELIGIINYDYWALYKDNIANFTSDDQSLKVIDKQNNVVFDIQFVVPNTVVINGYNVGDYQIIFNYNDLSLPCIKVDESCI